jgi:ParB family chromosome partitioning protein
MTAKRGLGRGLGALISDGEGLAPAGSGWTSAPARDQLTEAGQLASVRYAEIPIELLRPNPKQPRQVFDGHVDQADRVVTASCG